MNRKDSMTHSPNTEQRAEFEEWARPFYILDRTSEDKYEYQGAYIAWFAWQAARATRAAPASPEPASRPRDNEDAVADALAKVSELGTVGAMKWLAANLSDRAPASPNTEAVPDGWMLVPKVPTNDMLQAWFDTKRPVGCTDNVAMFGDAYAAMFAATPSPSKGGEADSAAEDNTGKES